MEQKLKKNDTEKYRTNYNEYQNNIGQGNWNNNGFDFEESQESSLLKAWKVIQPFLLYYLVHAVSKILLTYFVGMIIGMLPEAIRDFLLEQKGSVNGLVNAISLLIGMAAIWPMAKREWFYTRACKRIYFFQNREAYVAFAVFAVLLAIGMNLLMFLTGILQVSSQYEAVAERQYNVNLIIGLLIYGIISPFAEEVVFRGLIYQRMKRFFPVTVSIILSGVLFGFYHGNIVQALYGTILGIAITFCYERFNHFFVPVLFHSLANITVFLLSYEKIWLENMIHIGYTILFLVAAAGSFFVMLQLLKRENREPEVKVND